jgi:anti-sigma-K factor RskA
MTEKPDMRDPPDGRCGDAALYLLGLLGDRQASRFRDHAEACAVCRDELGALRPAVDVLPATVPQLVAPEHVKQRVMAVVRAEASPQASAARSGAPWTGRAWRRMLFPSVPPRRLALGLGAAALLAGGAAIGVLSSERTGSAPRLISAQVTVVGAHAVLHQGDGHNWLTVVGLPQPRAGRVYEVWVKRPGKLPQPTNSLFTPTAAGTATAVVPSGLAHASQVMVTQEPDGGSELPTSAPVIVAHVG